jgi:hypothetical protein
VLVYHRRCLPEPDGLEVAVPVPFEELQEAGLGVRIPGQLVQVVVGQVQLVVASAQLETVVLVGASLYLAAEVVVAAKLELVAEGQDLPYSSLLGAHALVLSICRGHTPLILVEGQSEEVVVPHVVPYLAIASGKCLTFEVGEGALLFAPWEWVAPCPLVLMSCLVLEILPSCLCPHCCLFRVTVTRLCVWHLEHLYRSHLHIHHRHLLRLHLLQPDGSELVQLVAEVVALLELHLYKPTLEANQESVGLLY